ncbi:MAG: hypothetical protein LC790_11465 [Actinobacteria bacterium]|nr:hypothetical protein [Actinomycetota bacterium]
MPGRGIVAFNGAVEARKSAGVYLPSDALPPNSGADLPSAGCVSACEHALIEHMISHPNIEFCLVRFEGGFGADAVPGSTRLTPNLLTPGMEQRILDRARDRAPRSRAA